MSDPKVCSAWLLFFELRTQSAHPSALLSGEGATLEQLVSGASDLKTKLTCPSNRLLHDYTLEIILCLSILSVWRHPPTTNTIDLDPQVHEVSKFQVALAPVKVFCPTHCS